MIAVIMKVMADETVFQFMSDDHDRLDEIFSKIKEVKSTDLDQAVSLFKTFRQGLEQHIVWEEEVLFPEFEEKTGNRNSGPTEVMRQEHVMIKSHLKNIGEILDSKSADIDSEADAMLNILKIHNDKEESILYPMIDRLLGKKASEIVKGFRGS